MLCAALLADAKPSYVARRYATTCYAMLLGAAPCYAMLSGAMRWLMSTIPHVVRSVLDFCIGIGALLRLDCMLVCWNRPLQLVRLTRKAAAHSSDSSRDDTQAPYIANTDSNDAAPSGIHASSGGMCDGPSTDVGKY